MQTTKYIATQTSEEFVYSLETKEPKPLFIKGDILTIDWDHYDTELVTNLTQEFSFGPIGKSFKLLQKIED